MLLNLGFWFDEGDSIVLLKEVRCFGSCWLLRVEGGSVGFVDARAGVGRL